MRHTAKIVKVDVRESPEGTPILIVKFITSRGAVFAGIPTWNNRLAIQFFSNLRPRLRLWRKGDVNVDKLKGRRIGIEVVKQTHNGMERNVVRSYYDVGTV